MVSLPAGEAWPAVSLSEGPAGDRPAANVVDERRAVLRFVGGCHATFDREARSARLFVAPSAPAEGFRHAFLAATGAIFARWHGRHSFHAGAFVADGGAWAVVGPRGAGKSSTLGALVLRGYDVLTDDLVVVAGGKAIAGPRCIDLRRDVVSRLGVQHRVEAVRGDDRWRVWLGQVEPERPIRGTIYLGWGRALELRPLSPAERLRRLAESRSLSQPGADATALLELAGLPAWELRRPPGWASMAPAVDLVETVVRTSGRQPRGMEKERRPSVRKAP
jgi:hypothetical protein